MEINSVSNSISFIPTIHSSMQYASKTLEIMASGTKSNRSLGDERKRQFEAAERRRIERERRAAERARKNNSNS